MWADRQRDEQFNRDADEPYDSDTHGPVEEYMRRHRPVQAASIARQVDLAMAFDRRPCLGNGCDEDRCPRHERTTAVVARYLRMKGARP